MGDAKEGQKKQRRKKEKKKKRNERSINFTIVCDSTSAIDGLSYIDNRKRKHRNLVYNEETIKTCPLWGRCRCTLDTGKRSRV